MQVRLESWFERAVCWKRQEVSGTLSTCWNEASWALQINSVLLTQAHLTMIKHLPSYYKIYYSAAWGHVIHINHGKELAETDVKGSMIHNIHHLTTALSYYKWSPPKAVPLDHP